MKTFLPPSCFRISLSNLIPNCVFAAASLFLIMSSETFAMSPPFCPGTVAVASGALVGDCVALGAEVDDCTGVARVGEIGCVVGAIDPLQAANATIMAHITM